MLLKKLSPGSVFAGRYQVIEEIGKGGMGSVYKVLDKELGEMVALKLLNPEIAADESMVGRFRHELRLARKITHKNVCRMFDLSIEKGEPFITMEYVSGEDLKSTIRRVGKLPVEKSVDITIQVCQGLTEAHNLGVVHRDLKPQNVMLDSQGFAHIMDFGIARSTMDENAKEAQQIIGTPDYMSPEQAEGLEADHRSDIYALGIILFEMLTGNLPFKGNTLESVLLKHQSEAPPDPRKFIPSIPSELSRIILRCLTKEKERRYQSVEELISELKMVPGDLPSEVGLPIEKTGEKNSRKIFQRRFFLTFVFPVFLIAALSAVFLVMSKKSSKSLPTKTFKPEIPLPSWKHSIAVLPFRNLSAEADQDYFCDGMTEQLITNLAHIRDLKVPARTSIMMYKNVARDVRQIAQELEVSHILEGSVRKSGNQIRITAQLIDVEANAHIWAQDFDRRLDDIFAIQDDVSQAIVSELQLELSDETDSLIRTPKPSSIQAYEYYMKSRHTIHSLYLNTHKEEDFQRALEFGQKAVEIDPVYAPGYMNLGYLYEVHYIVTREKNDREIQSRYLNKTYELDPHSAEANAGIGFQYSIKKEHDKAFPYIRRAVELNPNSQTVCHLAGIFYGNLGLDDLAIGYFSRAIAIDRLAFFSLGNRALFYINFGEFEKAKKDLLHCLENGQSAPMFIRELALIHILLKEFDEADKLLTKIEKELSKNFDLGWCRALYYASRGQKDLALSTQKNAAVFALLGKKKDAIARMQDELKTIWWRYSYPALVNLPLYDNLRDEPEFQSLVENQKSLYEQNRQKYAIK